MRARGAPTRRRRSAERPTFRWSAERPAIRPTRWRRLGGASAISFLGRTIDHAGRHGAGRALDFKQRGTGYRKQAALKDQRDWARSPSRAGSSCARGAHRPGDVGQQSDPCGQQSDPRSGRPARWRRLGRRFGEFRFCGRTIDHAAATAPGARWLSYGVSETGGIERSTGVTRVNPHSRRSSCARGRTDPATSVEQSDPHSGDPSIGDAGAGWAALRLCVFLGRTIDHAAATAPGARCSSYGVSANRRH